MYCLPRSFTGIRMAIDPGVWPGVTIIVIVVSPNVSVCPSVTETSRAGNSRFLCGEAAMKSQSAPDINTRGL